MWCFTVAKLQIRLHYRITVCCSRPRSKDKETRKSNCQLRKTNPRRRKVMLIRGTEVQGYSGGRGCNSFVSFVTIDVYHNKDGERRKEVERKKERNTYRRIHRILQFFPVTHSRALPSFLPASHTLSNSLHCPTADHLCPLSLMNWKT